MRYNTVKYADIANGPGVRVSLFTQGCEHHCPGCFNPEAWSFEEGDIFTNGVYGSIIGQLGQSYIRGLSILGGEPLHPWNVHTVILLCHQVKNIYPDKTIWLYTGYAYESLSATQRDVLKYIDVLVDGPFKEEHKVLDLRFRGSLNQRIIDVPKTLEYESIMLWDDGDEINGCDACKEVL